MATPSTIRKNWLLVDASGQKLGRLASEVAKLMRGKHKPYYTPNQDCGDGVVIINLDKLDISDKKMEQQIFYWHTGYTGIKQRKWKEMSREDLMMNAVRRMLPKESPLARQQLSHNLRVYLGSEHLQEPQKPIPYNISLKPGGARGIAHTKSCSKTSLPQPVALLGFSSTSKPSNTKTK